MISFDKNEWKQEAFYTLKQRLHFAQNNRFAASFESAKEDHIVVIYGTTQIGKTTLILNTIGIKDDCFEKVYQTLRADRSKGTSATSTAIIYSISGDDNYYLAIREINSLNNDNMESFPADGTALIKRLKEVREQVEKGRFNVNDILYIYIPRIFFRNDIGDSTISIIDLPGDNSNNAQEMVHVSNLLTKYIPIASTCIIATVPNRINDLRSIKLPNKLSWQDLSHRFVLVITNAYNDANARSLLPTANNEMEFYDAIQHMYETGIRNILGSHNKTKVYPVDIGDSLSSLCKNVSADKRKIIISAKDRVLRELQKAITCQHGERLKAAMDDLNTVVNINFQDKIQELRRDNMKHNDVIKKLEKENGSYDNIIDYIKNCEIKTTKDNLKLVEGDLNKLDNDMCFINPDNWCRQWWRDVDDHYEKQKWYSFNHIKLLCRSKASDFLCSYISQQICVFEKDYVYDTTDNSRINLDIDSVIIDITNKFKKALKKDEIFDFIGILASNIHAELISELKKIQQNINVRKEELEKEHLTLIHKLKRYEELSTQNRARIQKEKSIIENNDAEIRKSEQRVGKDKEILKQYIDIVTSTYHEFRDDLINQMNSAISPSKKAELMLYMGILDNDYLKVIGGVEK